MWFHHLSIDHHLMRGKLNALCLFYRQLCMNTYITADWFLFFFFNFYVPALLLSHKGCRFLSISCIYSHWHHWVFVFVYTFAQHFFFTLVPRQIYFSSKTTSKTHNIDLIATQNLPEILRADDLIPHRTVKVRIALAKGVSQVFYKRGNYKKSVLHILLLL